MKTLMRYHVITGRVVEEVASLLSSRADRKKPRGVRRAGSSSEAKIKANTDYSDRIAFGRKCLMNVANSGKFSSDRAILEYAKDLWHVDYRGKKD